METASLLSELARVVIQERLLLEEVFELQNTISALEVCRRRRNRSGHIVFQYKNQLGFVFLVSLLVNSVVSLYGRWKK